MSAYQNEIKAIAALKEKNGSSWNAINPECAARMRIQNRFKTGLDIARYTAAIVHKGMAEYDVDSSVCIQSLGRWHGFIGQQKLISIKKHLETTNKHHLYLSGWMVIALRFDFGPLPDQSIHKKTAVSGLIEKLYTFLRQAGARESDLLFTGLDATRTTGDEAKETELLAQIDNFETHVVPIIADIDAGFGNAEATYLLAKKMIEASACCIQIEDQVSGERQCGHQDGRVTISHIGFLAKTNAIRYAFLELGMDDDMIIARTDSLGAGLIERAAVTNEPGDLGDLYNSFLDYGEISKAELGSSDVVTKRKGKLLRPRHLASNLLQFRKGTSEDRCVLDCIIPLQNGADLLWIETEKSHVSQIKAVVDRIHEVIPNVKLVYSNSPSFNWTLSFRQRVFDAFVAEGKDASVYDHGKLMSVEYDDTELAKIADEKIRTFQRDGSTHAGIFHHLITLPAYHTAALPTDNLAEGYLTDEDMLTYVEGVQRQELCQGIVCVKHQNMVGPDIDDSHKRYFAGEVALKTSGKDNTMNQFR